MTGIQQSSGPQTSRLNERVTFHLFCFAVLLKNMRKMEPLYVISYILVSIAISSIPLITNSYGPTGEWCWKDLRDKKDFRQLLPLVAYPVLFCILIIPIITD